MRSPRRRAITRATISKWVKAGGPPAARAATTPAAVDERWSARIDELLRKAPLLLATSVFEIIKTEGYTGSYPSVSRELRARRGPRFQGRAAVSIRIETPPGEEAQFDFSDATAWGDDWGIAGLQCFSAILSWSRWRLWWFTTSVDREHTFEGLIRFFEAAGGVPKVLRTDRMGALGSSQGRRFKLHPPAQEFARFHGTEIRACQAARREAEREGGTTVSHQANAKLVFHAVLSREATGSRIYLQVQHTRRPRSPLVRSEDVSSKEHRTVKR